MNIRQRKGMRRAMILAMSWGLSSALAVSGRIGAGAGGAAWDMRTAGYHFGDGAVHDIAGCATAVGVRPLAGAAAKAVAARGDRDAGAGVGDLRVEVGADDLAAGARDVLAAAVHALRAV